MKIDITDDEPSFLMANDSDEFNRWDEGQQLAVKRVLGLVEDLRRGGALGLDRPFIDAFGRTLVAVSRTRPFRPLRFRFPPKPVLPIS